MSVSLRVLVVTAALLCARPASAQLGRPIVVGPYQPSMFTPTYTYYNPSAYFYGPAPAYYGPVYLVPAYDFDPYFYSGAYPWPQNHRRRLSP